ncbi:SDR family NAD(P)-dependent oxidoreductase [Streptomyces sp. NBC_01217]|uniref:SDR family NAD(P)-dependent oxidoreductase n=1 Tax=Streptomyces sp. NBC_01217 TaxID=2903779 RepID=UPI002E10D97A|nr:SDR family NAD(P)-dependent oxidoreductase [Streptomyces sp. NBC_01217]
MTSPDPKLLDALRASLKETERLRAHNERIAAARTEPIAVVGMACRLPGDVTGPDDLWRLLVEERDAITPFPEDRGWDLAALHDPARRRPGTTYVAEGGFLHDAAAFDPAFFRLSPKEAAGIDPQQRLLLEVSWEALEDAGIDTATLAGTPTGVYTGLMLHDYDGAAGVGSLASGRVSYTLGLQGPALTLDTACSSSLVAVHLAVNSLRAGTTSLALAGGATVMATLDGFIEFSRQGGLSPDGRCRSFSDDADGTGWAEGVGVLVLERLSDARRNGHQVLAVVRGTGVNQDGASNGQTAPNGPAQQALIRAVLADAGLTAHDIDAVEAHGTATTLGDPIEADALLAAYGEQRPEDRPLWIGSLKSNIGHTQAAAGVAGIIKMILAMRHGTLPRTLHVTRPTTEVDWSGAAARLLTEARPWPETGRPRRAGVSSFGISGTNAHVILEQAPADDRAPEPTATVAPAVLPWALSAHSPEALRAQAARLLTHVEQHAPRALDVAYSLATTRTALPHRAVVVGADPDELVSGLAALALAEDGGAEYAGVVAGSGRAQPRIAFVFPGQGSQRAGAGRELYGRFPVFAAAMDECLTHFDREPDRPLRDLMFAEPDTPEAALLNRTAYAQPALFTLGVALYRLVESWGVRPDVVAGHSIGELAAAHVTGVLSLPDACELVSARARLMDALPEGGAMAAITLSEADATPWLAEYEGRVALAAVNGPESVVLSGAEDAVTELTARLADTGVRVQRLRTSHAFHSPLMEPMLERFEEVARRLRYTAPTVPIVSTVTGASADPGTLCDPRYWVDQVRRTVRYGDAVTALLAYGVTELVELGPDRTLSALAGPALPAGVHATPVLRRDRGEEPSAVAALAALHTRGAALDWHAIFAGTGARRATLPTYAFQHERFWLNPPHGAEVSAAGLDRVDHALLGAGLELPGTGGFVFTGRLSARTQPWLADRTVDGVVALPGSALLELALAGGRAAGVPFVSELLPEAELALGDTGTDVHVVVDPADAFEDRAVRIFARESGDAEAEWVRHAHGTLTAAPDFGDSRGPMDSGDFVAQWPPLDARPVDLEELDDLAAASGVRHGPAFRGLTGLWRGRGEVFAEVALPAAHLEAAGRSGLHPALLELTLHAIGLTTDTTPVPLAPAAWRDVCLHTRGATALRVRLRAVPGEDDAVSLDAVDASGLRVLSVGLLRVRAAQTAGRTVARSLTRAMYRLDWAPLKPTAAALVTGPASWAVLGGAEPARESGEFQYHATPADLVAALDGGTDAPEAAVLAVLAPPEPVPDAAQAVAEQVLSAVQIWLAEPRLTEVPLVFRIGGTGRAEIAVAAARGLLRSAQQEHPGRFVIVNDDAADTGDLALPILAAALASGEPEVTVTDGVLHRARLLKAEPSVAAEPRSFDPDGTVLVTGGTGGLAGLLARHLVSRHGVRHLLLASRSGERADGAADLKADLEAAGVRVRIAACDVADFEALAGLLAGIDAAHPLTAVYHTAGVLDDGTVEALTAERLHTVLRPKTAGAWHLHELTRDRDLTEFTIFSSIAGTLGSAGQANYAAANATLDALAEHRRGLGLPAQSLAWGPWDLDQGMTAGLSPAHIRRMAASGLRPVSAERGMALLDAAARRPEAVLALIDVDTFRTDNGADTPRALSELTGKPGHRATAATTGAGAAAGSFAARMAASNETERPRLAAELVRGHVAAVLGLRDAARIDPRQPLRSLGFDSLSAVGLRNRLVEATGLRLATTVVFDHPSVEELGGHLVAGWAATHQPAETPAPSAEPTRTATGSDADDPLVIVGMACRFPGGVTTPEDLWRLVDEGTDAITGFPDDRGWDLSSRYDPDPARTGTTYTQHGGFLHDAARFDAGFFGISPREARAMDPQQRLLLETSWEALERAAIDPRSLRHQDVGVFVGAYQQGYGLGGDVPDELEGYVSTGAATSVISGRLAYVYGLTGLAVTVDTACSSSLVALHFAAQSLRSGDCSMALVGAATVMATLEGFVEFSRQGGLSPDGRCRAFSDDADGTGWAEGAGVLVVERMSDAVRLGHRPLAVIRGSAVNQDGASNGLTAPNGSAQRRVIRRALASAGLGAGDVDAVEAHGTATTLGDPIEAEALLDVYGRERPSGSPLWVGTVKSNIGHTQAAAGLAGIIKMIQAMHHGVLPRTLHVTRPTTKVDWDSADVRLLTEARPWTTVGRPRRAAVSSFGISGTNAHVILEQPADPRPETAPLPEPDGVRPTVAWVLSGADQQGLRDQAARLLSYAEQGAERGHVVLTDVGLTLTTRAKLDSRAVVLGSDRAELLAGLAALADGRAFDASADTAGVVAATARSVPRVGFVFPGQGSQRPGAGRELYERYPVFAAAVDECLAALAVELGSGLGDRLKAVFFAEEDDEGVPEARLLNRTGFAQPVLFTLGVAMLRLLESWGVRPDAVAGHSIGEIAAAHAAGVLSLADACALVGARARLMEALPDGGAMAAIAATEHEVHKTLAEFGDRIGIAAVNGPASVVVSGDAAAVDETIALWTAREVRVTRLRTSHAFHSPLMEPMLAEFARAIDGLKFSAPRLPLVSTAGGVEFTPGPDYWVEQVRRTVRFGDAVGALVDAGVTEIVELGPGATLSALVRGAAPEDVRAVPLLRRRMPEQRSLLTAAAEAFTHGVAVSWPEVFAGTGARRVDLPTYAFRRERYWLDSAPGTTAAPAAPALPTQPAARASGEATGLPERLVAASDPATWWYRVGWQPLTTVDRLPTGRWLVAVPGQGVAAESAAAVTVALTRAGVRAELFAVEQGEADRRKLATRLRTSAAGVRGVVSLLGLAEQPHPEHPAVTVGMAQTLALTQALADAGIDAPLWTVTRGAVSVSAADHPATPTQAQLWGYGRVAALERPHAWGGLLDLPTGGEQLADGLLAAVLAGADGEDQIALRADGAHSRRLLRGEAPRTAPDPYRPRGTVLITGGTGGVGAALARRLAGSGADHLVLLSRSGPGAPGAAHLTAELEAGGARVTVTACDVADRDAVAAVLAELADEPLTAVFHAAGVVRPVALTDAGPDMLADTLSAKAGGAAVLDELLADRDLDAFVLFASGSGVWGSVGHVAYAPANAALDALAERRRARGLAATSVAWGVWAGGGMADEESVDFLLRRGMVPMADGPALDALLAAVGRGDGHAVVADIDWDRFAPSFTALRPSPLIAALAPARTTPAPAGPAPRSVPAEPFAGLTERERREAVLDLVRGQVAAVLGHGFADAVDLTRPLPDLGFDSLTVMDLSRRLGRATGLDVPVAMVFDRSTPTGLAEYLLDGLAAPAAPGAEPAAESAATDVVSELYRKSIEDGKTQEGVELLLSVARLRPTFFDPAEVPGLLRPVPLVGGEGELRIVFVNPISPITGAHVYYRMAGLWSGDARISALPAPGFAEGEPLPADPQSLIALQARAVLDHVGDAPFVLVGSSSGGMLAHEIAHHLHGLGRDPLAVAMMDTYTFRDTYLNSGQNEFFKVMYDRSFGVVPIDSTRLSAYMWLYEMFTQWRPRPLGVPTLLLRATEAMSPELAEEGWQTRLTGLSTDETVVDVPGNHFSMVEEHVETTIAAVHDWLTGLTMR